jgi:plasminogen activator inhibitor 1 RNA-binding protein
VGAVTVVSLVAAADLAAQPARRAQFVTLDEYLKTKAKPAFELPAARRANEGADDSQWKDAVPLEKEEEELFGELKKASKTAKKTKERKEVVTLDIQPRPLYQPESTRGRGGFRGGRGGSRGGREGGRDGGREGGDGAARPPPQPRRDAAPRERRDNVPVLSDKDFPSLGK